jgi:hypothetical protein
MHLTYINRNKLNDIRNNAEKNPRETTQIQGKNANAGKGTST